MYNGVSINDGGLTVGLWGKPNHNGLRIGGSLPLELGADVRGKNEHAGKIAYQAFSGDGLDIVGAGTAHPDRKVRIWDKLCINNTCIEEKHLKMLTGEHRLRIQSQVRHKNQKQNDGYLRNNSDGNADFWGGAGDWEQVSLRAL